MPRGQKKSENIVKIQVEAKPPARRKRKTTKKKTTKKKTTKKKTTTKKAPAIPKQLIENFVSLQKVQADLAEKLNNLAGQVTELLDIFKATATTFSEKPATLTCERDNEFMKKINQLLEQDKIIARGVTHIDERMDDLEKAALGHELEHEEHPKEHHMTHTKPLPKP